LLAVGPRVDIVLQQALDGRNRLPRSLSLKSRTEITELLRGGRKYSSSLFTLFWKSGEQFKYGVFLSGKFGCAVRRNRIKRLYREAIRLSRNKLRISGSVAFLPRRNITKIELEKLKADVSGMFERISTEN